MYKKVDSWVDIIKLEHTILKFWDETDSFNTLRKKNKGNPRWSFLDGPITANNPMGVHHAWGRTLKDMFQRYWAMNGRELRYQNGFDCQGLWVEVEVEKEHGFTSKADIENFGIDRFVNECKARANKFSKIQSDQSIRLGYWMDWDNSYYTMSDENNYTIWSFLKKCWERGKIYKGNDVMPWSGRSGTGYSQMEVVEGRKLVAHEAIFLKFPLLNKDKENLLLWTTTPWTLTSNIAAMINTDLEYIKIRCKGDNETYYFAAENLHHQRMQRQFEEKKEWIAGIPKLKTLAEIFDQRGGFEILGYVKGSEMLGWEYSGPYDEMEAQKIQGGYPFVDPKNPLNGIQAHKVIDGGRDSRGEANVVIGEGTGIVHTAPGCGDIDHVIGKEQGLPIIAPLDENALFISKFEPLTGKHALDQNTVDWIINNLKEKNLLVHTEMYPHVYPHCWRSGDPLVFRLVDEWYINMDWREEIKDIVKKIEWIPDWGEERELQWLENMRDWMISKKRYWGLALPIWECHECGHFTVIGSKQELKDKAVEGWDKFEGHSPHRPWVDNVKIACEKCGTVCSRILDVGNPWLDAGIVPYSTVKYMEDREYWKKWMPADLILECFPGQFRNWFYSLLAMSTMMENIPPFKTLVGHALVKDEKGHEMHKSTGNAIWFDDAAEIMGADIMRWIYCRQEYTSNLNFGYSYGREIRGKFFNTFWNCYSFFINYARIENIVPGDVHTPVKDRPDFDRWIISNLQMTIKRVRAGIESYQSRNACLAIESFVEDLSNWYIRHCRRRFWKVCDDTDSQMAYETMYECLHDMIRLAAPMMPFTTEEMYQNLIRSHSETDPISVHCTDYPEIQEDLIDETLSMDMDNLQKITKIALGAREAAHIKVRQPLSLLEVGPATDLEFRAATRFSEILAEDLNVKKVVVLPVESPSPMGFSAKANFKTLGSRMGSDTKKVAAGIEENKIELGQQLQMGSSSLKLEIEGKSYTLFPEDLIIETVMPENQSISQDLSGWVSVNTFISEELEIEGMMRELLRRLQVQRKDLGLEIEDRIHLTYQSSSAQIIKLFEKFDNFLKSELLAVSINSGEPTDGLKEYKINGQKVLTGIVKANQS